MIISKGADPRDWDSLYENGKGVGVSADSRILDELTRATTDLIFTPLRRYRKYRWGFCEITGCAQSPQNS